MLFQAGTSEPGREFAARNAEAIFIAARSPVGARTQIEDVRSRAERCGREGGDILFFQGLSAIVGGGGSAEPGGEGSRGPANAADAGGAH